MRCLKKELIATLRVGPFSCYLRLSQIWTWLALLVCKSSFTYRHAYYCQQYFGMRLLVLVFFPTLQPQIFLTPGHLSRAVFHKRHLEMKHTFLFPHPPILTHLVWAGVQESALFKSRWFWHQSTWDCTPTPHCLECCFYLKGCVRTQIAPKDFSPFLYAESLCIWGLASEFFDPSALKTKDLEEGKTD